MREKHPRVIANCGSDANMVDNGVVRRVRIAREVKVVAMERCSPFLLAIPMKAPKVTAGVMYVDMLT